MKAKKLCKLLAMLLPLLLLLQSAVIPAIAAKPAALRLALISDPHVYPASMTNNYCQAFIEEATHNGRALEPTQALLEAALADLKARVKKEKPDFLLIVGDMTEWSEYAGHVLVSGLLRQFEKDTGVPVAVVPGNHDLELSDACDFSTGEKRDARALKREEFPKLYADLGYDLPNCERYKNGLSYAADLGKNYRLIAADTDRWLIGGRDKFSKEELRDWVLEQCKKAKAAGKTIIGMGHHPLGEQMGNQDTFMENEGFGDARQAAEAFADAGMHFYFSGHLHYNEMAMRVSDRGETLYDIMTAATGFYPGGYRMVNFSAAGKKITADARSVFVPLTKASPFPNDPYYDAFYGRCWGSPHGTGLAGWLEYAVRFGLGPMLNGLRLEKYVGEQDSVTKAALGALARYADQRLFAQPERLFKVLDGLIKEIVAIPVSKLPCTCFIKEYGFGDPNKPGTFEDMGNSALVYLFGKRYDVSKDAFMQDVLRRMQNGEFIDQLLDFLVPKILEALGGDIVPLLMNNPTAIAALQKLAPNVDQPWLFMPLIALVAGPEQRDALSNSLYRFASGIMTSQSPTGSPDGTLVYDGPVAVPTGAGTFRLPENLSVSTKLTSAEITWYTRQSAGAPTLLVTDKDGNPAPEVQVTIDSQPEDIMADQLDIGFGMLAGRTQPTLKHTARLTGLKPLKAYRFTAGDSARDWWDVPRAFTASWENPVGDFFARVWDWMGGMADITRIWRVNRAY